MKVTFFDTESTDLSASWGRILCCSFVDLSGEPKTFRADRGKFKGSNRIDDSKIVVAIRDELENSDIVVGWNSKLHDVPLLNARLALAGERKVRLGKEHGAAHVDLMWYASGSSMKIGSRKLDNVSIFFDTPHKKTPLDGTTWQLAAAGDSKAMNAVVEHCESDVLVTRDLWPHLAPYIQKFTFTLSEVWQFVEQIPSRTP